MARAARFGRSLRSASNRRASFDDLGGRFAPRGSAPLPRLVEGPIARCGRYAEGTQSPPHLVCWVAGARMLTRFQVVDRRCLGDTWP